MLQPVGSQRWARLNIRRTSARRGVPRLRWLEAGPVLGGPREPPPSHAGAHIPTSQTGKPRLPSLLETELREGAHTRVSLGRSCFLSTELAAFVRRACAHCLSGGRYTWPTMSRRRVSSRKAPHPGQTPSSPHPGEAARMRRAAAAGTSALRP